MPDDAAPALALFDPATLYTREARRRRRRRARDLPRRFDPFSPPADPAAVEEWNEYDAIPLGGMLYPIEIYLHATPPRAADAIYTRPLLAYLATRIGTPR